MSKDIISEPINPKNKKDLAKFLKSGGRKGARNDFIKILKKAVGGNK